MSEAFTVDRVGSSKLHDSPEDAIVHDCLVLEIPCAARVQIVFHPLSEFSKVHNSRSDLLSEPGPQSGTGDQSEDSIDRVFRVVYKIVPLPHDFGVTTFFHIWAVWRRDPI